MKISSLVMSALSLPCCHSAISTCTCLAAGCWRQALKAQEAGADSGFVRCHVSFMKSFVTFRITCARCCWRFGSLRHRPGNQTFLLAALTVKVNLSGDHNGRKQFCDRQRGRCRPLDSVAVLEMSRPYKKVQIFAVAIGKSMGDKVAKELRPLHIYVDIYMYINIYIV